MGGFKAQALEDLGGDIRTLLGFFGGMVVQIVQDRSNEAKLPQFQI